MNRFVGGAVAISLFALDVFGENLGFWRTLAALAIHLIPSAILLCVLALAWRWEWVGAALYATAAAFYVALVAGRPLPPNVKVLWCATIAGPMLAIAALFLANWLRHAELRARR